MPIYEYQCQACGIEHEVMQKLNEQVLTMCPACGKPNLKKRMSAAGFQLKGKGWYATDFKGGSEKNSEKNKESGDKPADKTSSGTDTGPAKKGHGCGGGSCGCAH